ncbi:MAG: 4Fe-4S binding protein [Candidatus Aminicenantes bacterium]|nr:4Fe-4S binding protein [Candidatus Aminicenantes bacterium]
MNQYYHSIRIDEDKCDGRMKCMRICPTQAIRVRNGKAKIIEEKCIDCGECITACPNQAIIPQTDPFGELSRFKYTIAIPSPSLYAQFGREILPEKILAGLQSVGFNEAFDLALTCGEVSFAIQEYLRDYDGPKPLISNACPTVVRLIQVRYPGLIENLIPIDTPREISSRALKKQKSKEIGLDPKDIGTFYITPCPAKMISIKQPAEKGKSHLDGALSIADIYGPLLSAMEKMEKGNYRKSLESICILGIGWAISGGICQTLRIKNSLVTSGLSEILKVFDDIEKGKLRNIDFIEAYSCHQGCVGGSLTVENLYISYNKILKLINTLEFEKIKACPDIREVRKLYEQNYFFMNGKIESRPLKPLDDNIAIAIKKKKEKEALYESLPKIDCGVCGSPTCLAFAEDSVRGEVNITDCILRYPEKIKALTKNKSFTAFSSKRDKSTAAREADKKGRKHET